MEPEFKYQLVKSALFSAFMGLIGTVGSLLCLISAFSLPDDLPFLVFITALFVSFSCALLLSIPKKKKWCTAGAFTIVGLWGLFKIGDIYTGFVLTGTTITDVLAHDFSTSLHFPLALPGGEGINSLTTAESTAAISDFFLFSTLLLTVFMVWVLQRKRPAVLLLIPTVPTLVLCLLSVDTLPDPTASFMVLLFWLSVFFTQSVRRRDSAAAGRMGFLICAVFAVFFGMISSLFPAEHYEHTDLSKQLQTFFQNFQLPDLSQEVPPQETPSSDYGDSYIPFGTVESGTPVSVSQPDSIPLSSLGTRTTTGQIMLQVQSSSAGRLYLRGFSMGIYRDNTWTQIHPQEYKKIQSLIDNSSLDIPFNPLCTTQENLDLCHLLEKEEKSVSVNSLFSTDVTYVPYFSFPNRTSYNDSYLFIDPHPETFLVQEGTPGYKQQAAQSSIFETYSDVFLGEYGTIFREYQSFVYNQYLQIPDDIREELALVAGEMGLSSDMDPFTAGQTISDYFSHYFRYDTSANPTPPGEDFVLNFLLTEQKGYCMHFASAGTMLLRSIGIPARYVTGFAPTISMGTVDGWTNVTDEDAHAWVEVWYDDIGWIPLEVTPAAGLSSPQSSASSESSSPSSSPSSSQSSFSQGSQSHQQQQSAQQNLDTPARGRIVLLVLIGAFVLSCAGIFLRYILLRRKFHSALTNPEPGSAILALWVFVEKMCDFTGETVPADLHEIACEARFSDHIMTTDQQVAVADWYQQTATRIYKGLSLPRKLLFRLRDGLL